MKNATRIVGMPRLIALGILGGFIGLVVASQLNPLPLGPRSRIVPAAYRVPKIPGGTALRLAMVHDILHERYLRHGSAWYAQRNANAREVIAHEGDSTRRSAAYMEALDDLAIGLESMGQYEEAIATMRRKLLLVSPLPPAPTTKAFTPASESRADVEAIDAADLDRILSARHLSLVQTQQFATFANLGTILVHSAMPKAMAGDAAAKAQVHEGLDYIRRSIDLNAGAHFGRERWQAIAIEHLLACMDHRELLLNYDFIGDEQHGPGSARSGRFDERISAFSYRAIPDVDLTPAERIHFRSRIARTGIDNEWVAIVQPDYAQAMPFDEPTLAIIGMWTLGGGPSPHFALALGRTMENIGQRELAWNGYERAVELKDRFWPDKGTVDAMAALCRERQADIAANEAATDPDGWQDRLRLRHVKELAWGSAYQKAYQDYEAAQIAAGVPLDDVNFYQAFFKDRPSIASAPGLADDLIVTTTEARSWGDLLPCIVLGAGMAMGLALLKPARAGPPHP